MQITTTDVCVVFVESLDVWSLASRHLFRRLAKSCINHEKLVVRLAIFPVVASMTGFRFLPNTLLLLWLHSLEPPSAVLFGVILFRRCSALQLQVDNFGFRVYSRFGYSSARLLEFHTNDDGEEIRQSDHQRIFSFYISLYNLYMFIQVI